MTYSDNAAYHASRVDPEALARFPLLMFRDLLERRIFDGIRLLDRWNIVVVDGTVKEKCRQGFEAGGKGKLGGKPANRLPATINELKASNGGLVCYLFLSGKDKADIAKELNCFLAGWKHSCHRKRGPIGEILTPRYPTGGRYAGEPHRPGVRLGVLLQRQCPCLGKGILYLGPLSRIS